MINAITTNFGAKALMTFCLATMAPHTPILILMLILLVVDLLTGLYASRKLKEPFTSRRYSRTLEKFVFYSVAVVCAIFFEAIFLPMIPLAKIVAGFISSIELLSIYENIKKITGLDIGGKIKEYLSNYIKKK